MSRILPVVLAVFALAFAAPAQAFLITVNFIAAGQNGSFQYDSSIRPVGGGALGDINVGNTDLVSNISYSVGTTSWNSSNSGVSYLLFDASGNLLAFKLAGDNGGLSGYTVFQPDLLVGAGIGGGAYPGFDQVNWNSGTGQAGDHVDITDITWTTTAAQAPEPASWSLFVVGLIGVMSGRRSMTRRT